MESSIWDTGLQNNTNPFFKLQHLYASQPIPKQHTQKEKEQARLIAEYMVTYPRLYRSRPDPPACCRHRIPVIQTPSCRVLSLHSFQRRLIGGPVWC